MKVFNKETTRSALSFDHLIPALHKAFVAQSHVPLRHVHQVRTNKPSAMTCLIMPAWSDDGLMGVKIVNIAPANSELGKPGLHSTYTLYDATTGEPLALMDGDEITSRRTAAASALAASFLARKDASRLLILGSGRVASLLADAYAAVRPISEVLVWNRSEEPASQLVDRLKEQGYSATVVKNLAEATRAADIVTCATLATQPVIQGAWLQPGSHLDLIGSFTPELREADDDAFKDARIFIDTTEALAKSGELLEPMSRGIFTPEDIVGTLDSLCNGSVAGRASPKERTVFKSVGTALEDLAAATLVYQYGGSIKES